MKFRRFKIAHGIVTQGCFFGFLDVNDVDYLIRIAKSDSMYLRFIFKVTQYELKSLSYL